MQFLVKINVCVVHLFDLGVNMKTNSYSGYVISSLA